MKNDWARRLTEIEGSARLAQPDAHEVSAALVAIVLVLCAVFVPTTFLTGITGEFYRQFAVTIATATVISLILSLTLSPALAALLLRGLAGARWRGVKVRAAALAVLLATLYGVTDEAHQWFVPGRTAEVTDLVADALGAAVAAGVICGWSIVRRS